MQERLKATEDALPEPSAELILTRTMAQAMVRTLGPKKGARFLQNWGRILLEEDAVVMLLPNRSAASNRSVLKRRQEAVAWLRAVIPTLLASVPPDD